MADLNAMAIVLGARRSELGFTENEWEQFNVYIEAFQLFMEREAKYNSLWMKYGAKDSLHHMNSKVARTGLLLATRPSDDLLDLTAMDQDDPLDLINYTVFFLRNLRNGRIESSVETGDAQVPERWRVVDRWWTETPLHREYRVLEIDGSEPITQFRDGTGELAGEWKVYRGEALPRA